MIEPLERFGRQLAAAIARHGAHPSPSCEHAFVTAQGSAEARFWRAIATGRPVIAQSIAFELPQVQLEHALALVLLVRDVERERYASFAERFVKLLHTEGTLAEPEMKIAAAALEALGTSAAEAGARALLGLFEATGHRRATEILDEWLAR